MCDLPLGQVMPPIFFQQCDSKYNFQGSSKNGTKSVWFRFHPTEIHLHLRSKASAELCLSFNQQSNALLDNMGLGSLCCWKPWWMLDNPIYLGPPPPPPPPPCTYMYYCCSELAILKSSFLSFPTNQIDSKQPQASGSPLLLKCNEAMNIYL